MEAAPLPQALPYDEHNQELIRNVHPTDWVNPQPAERYNMVVLGAGTAGLVTAMGAAGLGAKVALVERHLMGGDCLNVGCVPSKALIRCARAAAEARGAGRFGVRGSENVEVDFPAVMERMRQLRAGISHHDSASRFREAGIDVFIGEARFDGPDTVMVGDRRLKFAKACIATGGRAAAPPVEGLEQAGYLTNESLFSLTELPRRLAVMGGGPIGSEMAQAFARFGSEVHLIEMTDHILPHEDPDVAGRVMDAMRADGANLHLNSRVTSVRRDGEARSLTLEAKSGTETLEVDALLVAVGRTPNVEGLELAKAGVEYDVRKGIQVNEKLQTSNTKIFAAGDVASRFKFTHAADAMARLVIRNALFLGRAKVTDLVIPWCTYTSPEVAHVGLYASQAEEEGIEIETLDREFKGLDRAILDGETEGLARVHVRKGKGDIVGATVCAHHAGDLIGEFVMAMKHGVKLGSFGDIIHPYPTQAEALKQLGDAWNRGRLTPTVKNLFTKWLAWTR